MKHTLVLASAFLAATAAAGIDPPPPERLLRATIVEIPDGDTIRVRLGERKTLVRLIGVDCPELHESDKLERDAARSRQSRSRIEAMGLRAADFTRQRLRGRAVNLELGLDRHDRYGRLLAYVWLPDGVLFNAELLREGYARALTIPPNVKYAGVFTRLAREAREKGRGLWGEGLQSLSAGADGHKRATHGWYRKRR